MRRFPVLYKLTANKNINFWRIIADTNCYWTEFGMVGGAMQTSQKTLCVGKNKGKINETTDEQQAELEAESIWKRKMEIENFVINIEDVGKVSFNPPMLAKVYNKKYAEDMRFIQPKLDGVRCNISISSEGGLMSLSRRNKPFYSTFHIEEELIPFFEKHHDIHLDGELYNHVLHDDFNKIVSLVKKQKLSNHDREEISLYVKYYVYDCWSDENPYMTFAERSELIRNELYGIPNIVVVPTYEIHSSDETDEYFRKFVSEGYEGAIIRLDAPYEHKRSSNLLKYKEFMDDEFEVLDVFAGKTNTIAESISIRLKNGNVCNATLAFSNDECNEILANKDNYIGKLATVRFFGITNDGMLRFPVVKSFNRGAYE